ncbi:hypothetical protein OEZ85_009816 [Tetradesmus obliquus]|uniref:ER membrane protein complex subunit 1 n=1 Tax=Tetradesmus obliquus TaxID=3088 RepID=A0ABY8UD04_TETOB|nr:hypothetical protein OEZ85_009816 [Tetradesmus obliquus]
MQVQALLLLLLLAPAWAIFEDQAGTYDWYKQYVGRPTTVAFLPGKERVFLSTQQNLLASLHTKAGSVAWRRKYTEQDPLEKAVALQKPALLLAASKGGKYVRAWDALEGGFKWEVVMFDGTPAVPGASCDIATVELGDGKGSAVAAVASDTLKLLGASKGDELWSASLEQASHATRRLLLTGAAVGTVSLVAYTPGSADVHVLSVAAADGSYQDTERITAAAPLGDVAAVSGAAVAVISEDGQQLCTLNLAGGVPQDGMSCVPLQELAPALAAAGRLQLAAAGAGAFALSSPGTAGVAIVSADGSVASFPAAAAASLAAATAASEGSPAASLVALAASSPDASSVIVQLLDTASGDIVERANVALPAAAHPTSGPAPRVVAAWLDASKRKGAAAAGGSVLQGCRLLLLWSDDQITLVSGGEVSWTREEALASGTSNLFIDLPAARRAAAAAADAAGSSPQASAASAGLLGLLRDNEKLKRWVRLQVLSVLVQFKLSSVQEQEEFLTLRQALSDNNLPFRDTSGFRKLIVLLTSSGKAFGLHSGDGRILWTSTAPAAAAAGSSGAKQHLRVWRRFHDLTHAPQLAVISAGGEGGSSSLLVLNGHTGEVLQEQQLPYAVNKVIPQPQPVHDGAADQFLFLLVEPLPASSSTDTQPLPKVHLLPDSASTQQHLAKSSGNLFFWLLQQAPAADSSSAKETVLHGFGFEANAVPDAGSGLLPVVPAWQVALPGALLGLAAKDATEPVHSYVKVLGDRSLKYNYLNPNLLFVATGTSPAGTADVPAEQQQVSVTLLNTVTGGVLHQQLHSGCAGPVHAVVSQNWVVYALRDVVALRQQATVIELYDASHHDLSIASILMGRTKHSAALSSYSSPPLEVLSQSFYLQHSLTGMAVSQTKQGITTKQLLVNTISDQVFALDKRYLDPRRPLRAKVTPEEAEERLLPYSELVVFSPLQYPTLDKQVLGLRAVSVSPTVLESTTLVLAYGADLFFSRISPALHFDSLQSDFSYGLLVVALLALAIGTWFAGYSSQQAMLKAKWQ